MKHQLVRFFTIFSLLTLLFGAVPAAPVGAEAHAVPLAASGDSLWAKSVGGTDHEYAAGIAADSNGNVYVTGSFRETADFDPGAGSAELTSAGDYDIFLLKLDGNGNYAWAKRIGSTGIDGAASIAADASNNIYVTGVFSGTVDFDPGAGAANLTSAGLRDIFVAKYDSDGNYIWAKRMGGGTNDSGLGLTVDAGGNVYTTGNYQGTADFDPGAGTANLTSAGNADVFVSKLDSNGNFVWAKSMGGTESEQGRGIAVSASGNVYTTGDFRGTADFDPGAGTFNLTSAGEVDVFISKLDSNGNFVWAKRIGGTDYEEGTAIAIDAEENIYTTGKYELTVDFDPGAGTFNLTSAGGGGDIFISKLDSGGNFVWAKSTGGTDFERGESIVLDANNNVYVTGVFSGTVDFDPGAGTFNLTGPGGEVFISILDQNGDFITARRMGGASYDWGTAITLDAQDNILVTGGFYETADFDPELTSAGDADVFIVKLEKVSVTPIDVTIGGAPMGEYALEPGENEVLKYGLTAGPVEISSDNGVGIIASLNQWRRQSPSSPWTGIAQSMALPVGLITNKYVMPRYVGNDPTLYNAILMANVDTVPRDITVTIGGTVQGTYTLGPSASEFVVYDGVVGGPIVVSSDDGAKIVASLYELKRGVPNVGWNGQSEMMGLPFTQLSDKYLIPIYFGDPVHTALNARLFIAVP